MTKVIVCAGGGGVGKTTSSAALSLALARKGFRTLVVTIDPARRLADAMGVQIGSEARLAHVEPEVEGKLWALMPEPREATKTFVEYLWKENPESVQRLESSNLFRGISDALAGMHEVVCMTLVARAKREHAFDYVVVDTAPSRYALDFVAYPGRLAQMLEGRVMQFFSSLADRSNDGGGGWAFKGVEAALGRVLGARLIRELTELFGELFRVRERFAGIAQEASDLLLGGNARYLLVAAPTGAALADVKFLSKKLDKLGRSASAVLLNRADAAPRPWIRQILSDPTATPAMREAAMQLDTERAARTVAADEMSSDLGSSLPRLTRVRMPLIEARSPVEIVKALAVEMGPQLGVLAGV